MMRAGALVLMCAAVGCLTTIDQGSTTNHGATSTGGATCPPCGANSTCENKGSSKVCVCYSGYETCLNEDAGTGFECVNLELDNDNCGGCGIVCGDGEACLGHQCTCKRTECVNDSGVSVCTDPETDRMNCGACGNICGPGDGCQLGLGGCFRCSPSVPCPPTSSLGGCVDPSNTSPDDCGGCGIRCDDGDSCQISETLVPTCVCGSGADGGDSANDQVCNGLCTDTARDLFNCGACGHVCAFDQPCLPGDAGAGVCVCNAPLQWCGATCVDPRTDFEHCGGCSACQAPATQCVLGKCR